MQSESTKTIENIPFDTEYHVTLSLTLIEWDNPADDEAYNEL